MTGATPTDRRLDDADTAWMGDAACVGVDPNLFHPSEQARDATARARQAKAICRDCPVRMACLEHALAIGHSNAQGVWGGLTRKEREEIARRRRITARQETTS